MADIRWTPSQYDAIHAQDGTVLVSAAAGSGKTAVLVARVIDLLTKEDNPCGIDELLIVTFTKAAAAQMREKIGKKIGEYAVQHPDNKRILRQKLLLPNAKICTIDSFCADVVRANYHKATVNPDSRMLDEGERAVIKREAFDEVAEEFYSKSDNSFKELVDLFSSAGDDSLLEKTVSKMYEYSCAYPFPEDWIRGIEDNFLYDNFLFKQSVVSYASQIAEFCLETAESAYRTLQDDAIILNAYGDAVLDDVHFFTRLCETAERCDSNEIWDELYDLVKNHKMPKIGTKPRGYSSVVSDTVKVLRDKYKDAFEKKLKKVFCADSAEDRLEMQKIYPIMKTMSAFLLAFSEKYSEKKREKNCADFSDVLHSSLSLLVEEKDGKFFRTEIAKQYSEKFKHILIDEYQDTNFAQDLLFSAVSRNDENLFFVGDVKQSIYSFRQAMPRLFIDKRKNFTNWDGSTYPANIILGQNFRSRKNITGWVNFVFSQIMSERMGEIDYNDEEKLVSGAEYEDNGENEIEIDVIDKKSFETDLSNIEIEAKCVAQRVKRLLESEMTVRGEDGQMRKIRKSDICILMRSATNKASVYSKALSDIGIESCSGENGNLFDETEIKVLLSLLKVIDNPLDDVPLVSVLMSPIFGFTADDISKLRIETQKNLSVYSSVVMMAEKGNTLCINFLNKLSQYRLMSVSVSPCELIDKLLEETGYADIVCAMKDGESRRENLYMFRDYASVFSKNGNIGLMGFLRLIEKMRQQKTKLPASQKSSSALDAVTVMTIHKSKGLEFPVCILANCTGKFNTDSRKASLIIHSRFGAGVMGKDNERLIRYETVNHTALKLETEFSEMSEEMRVLYVALTRAKEKLIMMMTFDNLSTKLTKVFPDIIEKDISDYAVRSCNSFGDWLLLCTLRHPGAEKLRKFGGITLANFADADFPIDVELIGNLEDIEKAEIQEEKSPIDENIRQMIEDKVSYSYEYSHLAGIPAKRGASEAKDGLNRDFFASSRPAFLDNEGLTPAQKGTAMHLFMQHSDYKSASDNLENEIDRLENCGFINEKQAKSLDRKKLRMFFSSKLAERMFNSPNILREKKFIISMNPKEIDDTLPETDEKIIIQGILDCAFEENGEMVIVDYKTDRVSSEDELRERYRNQLSIYNKAVAECMDMQVKETVLYSFHLEKEVVL